MIYSCVIITVAREFMSLGGDPTHHFGMTLRNPTQREEGCVNAVVRKQLKETIDIPLDSARDLIPRRAWDAVRQSLNLEIILDIDGHRVAERRGWPLRVHERHGTANIVRSRLRSTEL